MNQNQTEKMKSQKSDQTPDENYQELTLLDYFD